MSRHLEEEARVVCNVDKALPARDRGSYRSTDNTSTRGAAVLHGRRRSHRHCTFALSIIVVIGCVLFTGCARCMKAEVRVSWPPEWMPVIELVVFKIRNLGTNTWGPGGVEFRLSGVQGRSLSVFRDSVAPGEEVSIPLTEFLGRSVASVSGVRVGQELRLEISYTDSRSKKKCSSTWVMRR